ncbi:hypothetical protein SAMN05519103_02696 [Rhizobiales bacterium GAS113]|nr:hypothetical protein SAMN05519103_02696 [Rhizobiales bacterium GAS113]
MAMLDQQIRRVLSPYAFLLLAGFLAGASGRAQESSKEMDGMYQATVIVTGTDMRSRPIGFSRALREVLVKVSGEPRLHDDPRISQLAAHADILVASFGYADQMAGIKVHDDQGTYDRSYDLTVRFERERIDKVLAELGEQPWRGERPVVVPVVRVRGVVGVPYLFSAEVPQGADQRVSFFNSSVKYGITLRVPTESELAAWGVGVDRLPSPSAALAANQMLVAGTLEFQESEPIGWVGSWRMRWHDADYAWQVSGVNFDEAINDLARGAIRIMSGHDTPN